MILISPHFLYREEDARRLSAPYPLSGRELAERLAFTLWGSIPDAPLLKYAESGSLADSGLLRQEIARMLADPRSQALAVEFAAQAFLFAGFDHESGPDAKRFPEFTPSLREAMYQECLHFFSYILQEDRPLTDVIDAELRLRQLGLSWPRSTACAACRALNPSSASRSSLAERARACSAWEHLWCSTSLAAAAHQSGEARQLGAVPGAGHAAAPAAAGGAAVLP